MKKKLFVVRLTETERSELDALVRKGKASALDALRVPGFCSKRTRAKTARRRPTPKSRKP